VFDLRSFLKSTLSLYQHFLSVYSECGISTLPSSSMIQVSFIHDPNMAGHLGISYLVVLS